MAAVSRTGEHGCEINQTDRSARCMTTPTAKCFFETSTLFCVIRKHPPNQRQVSSGSSSRVEWEHCYAKGRTRPTALGYLPEADSRLVNFSLYAVNVSQSKLRSRNTAISAKFVLAAAEIVDFIDLSLYPALCVEKIGQLFLLKIIQKVP